MKVQYIFSGFSFCSAEMFRVIHAKGYPQETSFQIQLRSSYDVKIKRTENGYITFIDN